MAAEPATETIQPSLLDLGELEQGVRMTVCDSTAELNGQMGTVVEWCRQDQSVRVRMDGQGLDETPVVLATTAVRVITASEHAEDSTTLEEEPGLEALAAGEGARGSVATVHGSAETAAEPSRRLKNASPVGERLHQEARAKQERRRQQEDVKEAGRRPRSAKTRRSAPPHVASLAQKGTRRAEVAEQREKIQSGSPSDAFGGGAARHAQVSSPQSSGTVPWIHDSLTTPLSRTQAQSSSTSPRPDDFSEGDRFDHLADKSEDIGGWKAMVRKRQTERDEAAMAQELRHSVHRTVVSASQHAALAEKMKAWEEHKHIKRVLKQRQHTTSFQTVHKRKVSARAVVDRLYVNPSSSTRSEPVVRPAWSDGLRPEINKPHVHQGGKRGSSGGFHFSTTNLSHPPPLSKSSTAHSHSSPMPRTPPPSKELRRSNSATDTSATAVVRRGEPSRAQQKQATSPRRHSTGRSRSPEANRGLPDAERLRQSESIIKALRDEKVLFEAKLAEVENAFAHKLCDVQFELAERTRELNMVFDECDRREEDLRGWLSEQLRGSQDTRSPVDPASPRTKTVDRSGSHQSAARKQRQTKKAQDLFAREQSELQKVETSARQQAEERKKAKQRAKRKTATQRKQLAKAATERKLVAVLKEQVDEAKTEAASLRGRVEASEAQAAAVMRKLAAAEDGARLAADARDAAIAQAEDERKTLHAQIEAQVDKTRQLAKLMPSGETAELNSEPRDGAEPRHTVNTAEPVQADDKKEADTSSVDQPDATPDGEAQCTVTVSNINSARQIAKLTSGGGSGEDNDGGNGEGTESEYHEDEVSRDTPLEVVDAELAANLSADSTEAPETQETTSETTLKRRKDVAEEAQKNVLANPLYAEIAKLTSGGGSGEDNDGGNGEGTESEYHEHGVNQHSSTSTHEHRQKRRYSVSLKSHAELADLIQQIEADDVEPSREEHLEQNDSTVLQVEVPEGLTSGQHLYVCTPDGREIVVEIPEGVQSGQEFDVDVGESATTVEKYERTLAEQGEELNADPSSIVATDDEDNDLQQNEDQAEEGTGPSDAPLPQHDTARAETAAVAEAEQAQAPATGGDDDFMGLLCPDGMSTEDVIVVEGPDDREVAVEIPDGTLAVEKEEAANKAVEGAVVPSTSDSVGPTAKGHTAELWSEAKTQLDPFESLSLLLADSDASSDSASDSEEAMSFGEHSDADSNVLRVICPEETAAGDILVVQIDDESAIEVTVPEGVVAGEAFEVHL